MVRIPCHTHTHVHTHTHSHAHAHTFPVTLAYSRCLRQLAGWSEAPIAVRVVVVRAAFEAAPGRAAGRVVKASLARAVGADGMGACNVEVGRRVSA